MEGEIGNHVELDCAIFQLSSAHNRYEAIACSKGKTELVASGSLVQLVLHLKEAKKFQSSSSSGTFKLQLAGNAKGSSWFTKSTLARFLHIMNSSDASKSANGILHEMSQLEETRKFSLHSKEQHNPIGGALAGGFLDAIGIAQQGNVITNSSEATKNELLRALDLRLTALQEELVVLCTQVVGSNLSNRETSDLSAFVKYFGTPDLSWLLKCLSLILACQPSELPLQPAPTSEENDKGENALETCDMNSQPDIQKPITNSVSPAKLAQVERQISTESEDSSESSDESQAIVERSRPLIRSASPRRSASPMRRVQIGRSGSRRSTAITIKSLSYFPPRERIPLDKDDDSNSRNGETDQPPRKSDNNVRRMSVQDAINLFESRQKDQNSDSQNKKAGLVTTKSVLRRWSAGMGDSLSNKSQEMMLGSTSQSTSINVVSDTEKKGAEMKVEPETPPSNFNPPSVGAFDADVHDNTVPEIERVVSSPTYISTEQRKSEQDESSDRAIASAEWNRQKEAELNQMLMKMMEVVPGKFGGFNIPGAGLDDSTNEQKGGCYSQYREKQNAKLRAEKVGRKPVKEAQNKVLKETLLQNRAVMTPKTGAITEKRDSPATRRARRNSSPPVLPKKEVVSKTPAPKKSSPKPSPAPATRSSWSGGSLTKATTSQKSKSSPGMVSASTPTSRRKTPTTPSSSHAISKVEKPPQQLKNKKETVTATKLAVKGQEEKPKTVTMTSRRVKAKSSASEENSSSITRPGLYNKVAKKSSVVPVESKPVKKITGISQSVGSCAVKGKVTQLDDSPKDTGSVTQVEDEEPAPVTTKPTTKVLEADLAQPAHDENLEISLNNDLNIEKTEKPASSLSATEMVLNEPVELSATEVQPPDEDMGISSDAWIEAEHEEQVTDTGENVVAEDVISPAIAPLPSSSPRIRHSLSQMLQADSNEPEIIEWGNAENPPALVFQKDSPKGFKRLLKFARKNKGDTNANGWASPSVVSEGEDEPEESRGATSNNVDGANSRRRAFDGHKMNSILSAQSTASSFSSVNSDKLRDKHGAATTTKASRSFFSLSNFRSSKSNEQKIR